MDKNDLKNFKKIILKSMGLKSEVEIKMFNEIPDVIHASVFSNNFNGNIRLARNIIYNKFDQESYKKIEKEKNKIHDMGAAAKLLATKIKDGINVIFLTDTDNDGSLSQSNIIEFKKAFSKKDIENVDVLYCQSINGNGARGFTVDLLDSWASNLKLDKNAEFLIVSADNGINSRDEQIKINKKYKNATLIITDHHMPDDDLVVLENKKTLIVNPKYKPNTFFKEKNISGANVLGVLLERTLNYMDENLEISLIEKNNTILNMREISRIANLLDYVDTDISDKPLKDHLVEKYSTIGNLLNVNNSSCKIITSKKTNVEILDVFSNVKDLNIKNVVATLNRIKEQNKMAEKLLTLQFRYNNLTIDEQLSLPKSRIETDLIIELTKKSLDNVSNNINPNFIEQLRPFIFNYAASTKLKDYEAGIMEHMISVFSSIKRLERVLQSEFGKTDLINIEKTENSTIMYPKNKKYLSLLTRKLLGKIFNEENNGFLMILDNIEKTRATGSFRSLYRIQDILKDKKSIEDVLNIKLSFLGHDKAAGFFIESKDGSNLGKNTISDLNDFISNAIGALKLTDKYNYSHLIQTDFNAEAINVFNKYNKSIKGSLTNMQSLSPVIQFNKSTYITNATTQKEQNLQTIIKEKKYGYIPMELSFDGKTVILQTELLRQVAENNFKDGIQVSFMSDGVFIGNKIIKNINEKKLLKIRPKNTKRKEMIDFFEKHYSNNGYFTTLDMKYIKDSPFFKNNKFGSKEFKRYEATVIGIIDATKVDMVIVLDTEANGLGNAPKVSNIGVVELIIDEASGDTLKIDTFNNSAFKTVEGAKYLLTKNQISELKSLSVAEYDLLSFDVKKGVIINFKNEKFIDSNVESYRPLYNVKQTEKDVIVNRVLRANIGSIFIKDRDVKISERIKTLTSIDNTLLNKIGMLSEKADDILAARYKNKKCVFQAHNLPYDLGVIKGNFKNFYDLMTDFEAGNLLNDSAIYSRTDKLAYDPINIAVFDKGLVPSLNGIQFYHSNFSDLSMDKFLSNDEDGVMSDRTGRYVLKKKEKAVTIIDTKDQTETSVFINKKDNDPENVISDLHRLFNEVEMPKNAIKYSVQALSDYDTIRSMILSNSEFKVKPVEVPEEFNTAKSTLEFFMINYHFDSSFAENFINFSGTLTKEEKKDLFVTDGYAMEKLAELKQEWIDDQLENPPKRKKKMPKDSDFLLEMEEDPKIIIFKKFGKDFLEKNKEAQSKFHEVWAYKKVLQILNPTKKDLKDDQLIDIVSYQTSLSNDKIRMIMNDVIDHKKAYNIDHVTQAEPHNNVFFDECDAVMESILTFKRPTDKNYNSYTHSANGVVSMYLENILKTTAQHIMSQQRSVAIDSFSKKQIDSYKRRVLTSYIKDSQTLDIENVKFKFKKSTLPPDTFAYGVLKKEIPQDMIDEISKKLEFVAKNEQMVYSVSKNKPKNDAENALQESLNSILNENKAKIKSIKNEMIKVFEFVYFSRKETDSKKILQQIVDCILTNSKIKINKNSEKMMKREKDKIIDLASNFCKIANNIGVGSLEILSDVDFNNLKSTRVDDFIERKEGENLSIENNLTRFLTSIGEISEEELDDLANKRQNQNTDELKRSNIMDVVAVKRRDNPKQMFLFHELLDLHLMNLTKEQNISTLKKKVANNKVCKLS